MKNALLLCGQPRNISNMEIYNTFKEIITRYNCDVYIHFWYDEESGTVGKTYAPWLPSQDIVVQPDVLKKMIELYNPKKFLIEKPIEMVGDEHEFTNCRFSRAVYNLRSYYTSMKRVSELVDDPNQYKYIIRARCDILIHSLPEITSISDRLYTTTIHTHSPGVDNSILMYPSEHFYTMSSLIETMIPLYLSGVVMNDEEMLHGHLQMNGLLHKLTGSLIRHTIIRA
jgi:hypothetical protein